MSAEYSPPDDPLVILHQDHEILVVDKPSGLLSVPGKSDHLADCLMSRIRAAYPEALLVHRLDRDTSGVMVFALTPHAQRHLGLQFEKRQMKKTYVARLWGHLAEREGTVDLPLIVDWPNRPRQKVNLQEGKPSLTRYRVLDCNGDASRVELEPVTGRTHQLRLHMAAIGHPILGDVLYGGREAERLMLHAQMLSFMHPLGGERVTVESDVPF